jgi:alkaline phosphatase D
MPSLWKLISLFLLLAVNLVQAQHQEIPIAGPMAARVDADRAIIWVQLRQEKSVRCQCKQENGTLIIQSSQEVAREENDFIAWMQLKGLLANHYYTCELWLDEEAQGEKYITRFRTLPQNHEPIDFSMAVGSCAYLADYQYESRRQLLPYGGKYHIYDIIATHQADFMFWLGDNIYLRNGEWNSKEGVQYRYRHTRFHPALQEVMRTGSHFAIWDDHDFGPNDGDSTYRFRQMTRDIFKQVWPNPPYPDTSKLYTQYRIGDVAFFLMDDRSHRAPNDAPIDDPKPFLGKEQINWLIASLKASDASFKIISIGTQVLSNCNLAEGYIFGYPNELDEMLSRIQQEQIEGVLFFSGDKHLTEISRYDYPGLYPLLDLTISPFTSMPTPIKLSNSHRVKGTFVGRRNFGILNFVGEGEERRMIIRIFNAKGKMIWQKNIWARDLRIGE